MDEHGGSNFLLYAVVLLAAAVIAVPISKRFKLGAVIGYLLAGIAIGPQALSLVSDPVTLLTFSEIGVVMLLFVLGLELSPQRLWVMRRILFGLGAAQVAVVTILFTLIAHALGLDWLSAAVAAFGMALTSTAFALQILSERQELTAAHGRATFAVSLFQDLVAVPILAILPLLAVHEVHAAARPAWQSVAMVVGSIVGVVVAGRYLLRPVFRIVAGTGSVEVFSAMALLVVLGVALVMQQAGLSMGLGAFLAGVLLADSEYRHELESHIEPFKGLLLGLFFMGVGMNLDLRLLAQQPWVVLGLVIGVMLLQVVVMWAVARAFRYPQRAALLMAALLAAGGEFAFVVYATAERAGILAPDLARLLNLVVALAMAATPGMVLLISLWLDRAQRQEQARPYDEIPDESSQVVIAGFGRVGQIPARILTAQKVTYTVIDPTTEHVDTGREFGWKLYYGDAARPEILRAARVGEAKVFILAIDDPEHSLKVAATVRRLYPSLRIIARARNRQHAYKLMDLGIVDIVRETFHSALVISHRMLEEIGFDSQTAVDRIARFRVFDEEMLKEQHSVYDDASALKQSAMQARLDLEALFEADQARRR